MKRYIHLKSENVNIEKEGATGKNFGIFEILDFKITKWTENEPPPPLIGQPPLKSKIF